MRDRNVTVLAVDCKSAPCNISNSNRQPANMCQCSYGFAGSITWSGSVPQGQCTPKTCIGEHVTGKHWPECGCEDGYKHIFLNTETATSVELYCAPAKCHVSNSNGLDGDQCRCRNGYEGSIRWIGDQPHGACQLAKCAIANSVNDGPSCICQDGFDGHIAWNGPSASGECKPVPCRVPNSDFAPGQSCRCLVGFHGNISWKEATPSGTCLPMPTCSTFGDIRYAMKLTEESKDPQGNICQADQPLVARGSACPTKEERGYQNVSWSSAETAPRAECSWKFTTTECGAQTNLSSLVLPTHCIEDPGLPRCSSNIEYSATKLPSSTRFSTSVSCRSAQSRV